MNKYGFNLLWSEEDKGYIATCPDFPGLSAFGESPRDALKEATVALELFIESLRASGDSLPEVTKNVEHSGQVRLRMPKSLHSSLVQKAATESVSLNTWIITLLSERNATSLLVDKVFSKIDNVEHAIHVQTAISRIKISQTATYNYRQGEEYGKIESLIN